MEDIQLWAVLAAAMSSFVLGSLWYGFVFQRLWAREAGVDPEKVPPLLRTFVGAFVLSLLAAFVFALFLGPSPQFRFAVGAGVLAGLCWVATSFGINYLFARRSMKLFLLDGGYHTLQFTLYGAVLGAWPV
ncbi:MULTISPECIES: DUF1761 domain-containing protein [Oleiagrimonas]|jgi:hypothetical protein|uniref:DUF1761 domain-containing protein n=1 Tax=Oleiagrimonas citrea TaxID=1665687 RepID=A0A846ZPX4_9GAMM|nr:MULTISPECIES: DUF1761 domain-containing protein [Oleiagrimonas]NKZ39630.1 DUF1761 domain-containing protein [Oleiagrimonas citrea]RAP59409.1 hypothetical protein BTJ49_01735 [Oleiagrimonas sp. MCCC 1A03011]